MDLIASQVLPFVFAATLIGLACASAFAGDAVAPNPKEITPEQARCQAMGEGFFAVKGSTNCLRISGYVSAGAGFLQPSGSVKAGNPFASRATTFSDQEVEVRVESQFDTELGPGRVVVEVGGRNLNLNR